MTNDWSFTLDPTPLFVHTAFVDRSCLEALENLIYRSIQPEASIHPAEGFENCVRV